MQVDGEMIMKVYAPVATVVGSLWRWYIVNERRKLKASREERALHLATVDATLAKCEKERKDDRKECREQYSELQKRMDAAQDGYSKTLADAFDRMAGALETMAQRRGASSGQHQAIDKGRVA